MSTAPAALPPSALAEPLPRLSADLPLCHPQECAQCGSGDSLEVWQEHDERDLPEPIYLLLCPRCSDAIIEPHPRLYRCLDPHEPAPGAMRICQDCRWRAGTGCQHPRSKARRGPGVRLDFPEPVWTHIDGGFGKHGRREGRTITVYPGPVWGCDQKAL